MKTRKHDFFVGVLFVLVLVVFSLADRDTKRNNPNYNSIEQNDQILSSRIVAPDSAKANY